MNPSLNVPPGSHRQDRHQFRDLDAGSKRVTRRRFAGVATVAVGAMAFPFAWSQAEATVRKERVDDGALTDVNVTLGRWPFRRLPLDETPALVAKLRQHGVTQAWAGTFDGVLHKDPAAANARLADECRNHGRGVLLPFGSVNPTLPDWEEDLRRCAEVHGMPGIRLHPNYHGYTLDDPGFAKLLSLAAERRLVVQIVADMEDERMQHRLARVPHLDAKPLPGLLKLLPGLRLVLLNWSRSVNLSLAKQLADAGVCFDIATVEGVGGVANLIRQISTERVLFGSHSPFFYFESSLLKLKESALPVEQSQVVCTANARRLLAKS